MKHTDFDDVIRNWQQQYNNLYYSQDLDKFVLEQKESGKCFLISFNYKSPEYYCIISGVFPNILYNRILMHKDFELLRRNGENREAVFSTETDEGLDFFIKEAIAFFDED
ncbi:MAG: hypothetical protein FWF46_06910 [Oscillospiraceae bacterium]|nr:hypothetical protein [Oscillospiraceae bacterium]